MLFDLGNILLSDEPASGLELCRAILSIMCIKGSRYGLGIRHRPNRAAMPCVCT